MVVENRPDKVLDELTRGVKIRTGDQIRGVLPFSLEKFCVKYRVVIGWIWKIS